MIASTIVVLVRDTFRQARASRVSDPSTSGQTTYACLPASRWRRSREYASELRSSVTQRVTIGLRSAGGAAISETSRSP